ncbi:glycosyltransferase family 2 protein [Aestuariibius sp. 2305UL40-4]|uniref:glycosyltransferase family 2 protein n=1 Tax=Aestuariibius violaceus TaxID=3234132 RepID=UPI00345E7ED4
MSSTRAAPVFTVVMATYNRSHHILPSIQSVLRQSLTDFELLVIGDCCTDDTEKVVRGVADERVRWLSTQERWGTQSGPNNTGIAAARGSYIAYIGHDDIWKDDHLRNHLETYRKTGADCVVSGLVADEGAGPDYIWVLGLIDGPDAARDNFFPPSSVSHTKDAAARAGPWRRPDETELAVDSDFQVRLIDAGGHFASTGKISVFKFTASRRYLSYLFKSSDEQNALLEQLSDDPASVNVDEMVEHAKRNDRFMSATNTSFANVRQQSLKTRGLDLPPLEPLGSIHMLRQDDDARGADWHGLRKKNRGLRFAGPNAIARLLLPVTSSGPVRLSMRLCVLDGADLSQIRFTLNDTPVQPKLTRLRKKKIGRLWQATFEGELKADSYSFLKLIHPPDQMVKTISKRPTGLGVGTVILWPADTRHPAGPVLSFASRFIRI